MQKAIPNKCCVSQIIYLLRVILQAEKKIKMKLYYETICITKSTIVANYLEDTTPVHRQLAISALLSHTLSCLCS